MRFTECKDCKNYVPKADDEYCQAVVDFVGNLSLTDVPSRSTHGFCCQFVLKPKEPKR